MSSYIVPPDQTDADRIAGFVNGYMSKNKEQNRRMEERAILDVMAAVIAAKLHRASRRGKRVRRGKR